MKLKTNLVLNVISAVILVFCIWKAVLSVGDWTEFRFNYLAMSFVMLALLLKGTKYRFLAQLAIVLALVFFGLSFYLSLIS